MCPCLEKVPGALLRAEESEVMGEGREGLEFKRTRLMPRDYWNFPQTEEARVENLKGPQRKRSRWRRVYPNST